MNYIAFLCEHLTFCLQENHLNLKAIKQFVSPLATQTDAVDANRKEWTIMDVVLSAFPRKKKTAKQGR